MLVADIADAAPLGRWLAGNVEGFEPPFTLERFAGGQSNPTYRLDTGTQRYVLRRKPFGKLLASAHAVEREYRVIEALGRVGFPVPRAIALCENTDIIGSQFYVMEAVTGTVYWNAGLPDAEPAERRLIYHGMIETLAKLHGIDHAAIGLSDYGRPGNYFARQVERWTRQYRASDAEPIPVAERLIAFLAATVPPQAGVSIVHGDYRLDNLMFGTGPDGAPKVAAVLDWELSTLGDPLADFSYLLMHWTLPADGASALGGLDFAGSGIPDREEAVALYCQLTGRAEAPALDWYFAYNLFRLVGILQGIAGRVRAGNAASPKAAAMAARAPALADAAWEFACKAGA